MAKASVNVKVNINDVFALSNRTIGEGRFFTSLEAAVTEGKRNTSDEIDIIKMKLQDDEFVPVRWYDKDGNLIQDDELPTRPEGSE